MSSRLTTRGTAALLRPRPTSSAPQPSRHPGGTAGVPTPGAESPRRHPRLVRKHTTHISWTSPHPLLVSEPPRWPKNANTVSGQNPICRHQRRLLWAGQSAVDVRGLCSPGGLARSSCPEALSKPHEQGRVDGLSSAHKTLRPPVPRADDGPSAEAARDARSWPASDSPATPTPNMRATAHAPKRRQQDQHPVTSTRQMLGRGTSRLERLTEAKGTRPRWHVQRRFQHVST